MTRHILVIDDEASVRDSFVLALEDTGFTVDTAVSGEEGLEKFKTSDYDLIYLDLKMPGMNGCETLREIRKRDKKVAVYIVTAFAKEFLQDLSELRKEQIEFEIMQKPIGMDQIEEITRAVLN